MLGQCSWFNGFDADIFGGGTREFPTVTYVERCGVPFFHAIFIVTVGRLTELQLTVAKAASKHKIPFYFIRTRLDEVLQVKEDKDHSVDQVFVHKKDRKERKSWVMPQAVTWRQKTAQQIRVDMVGKLDPGGAKWGGLVRGGLTNNI